jgi:predicted Zn finger-like uncharacterized protein
MKWRLWKKKPRKQPEKLAEETDHTKLQGFESLLTEAEEQFTEMQESGVIDREDAVTCPNCGASFSANKEMIMADGNIRCNYCSNMFRIPSI